MSDWWSRGRDDRGGRDERDDRFPMTRRDVDDVRDSSFRDAERFLDAQRDERRSAGGALPAVVPTLETLGSGFLLGYLTGRSGNPNIGSTGVPWSLAVGTAGLLSNFMNWTPAKAKPHVEAAAIGALTAWSTLMGGRVGVSGALEAGGGGGAAGFAGAPAEGARATQVQPDEIRGGARIGCPPNKPQPPEMAASQPQRSHLSEAELQNIAQERMRNHGY